MSPTGILHLSKGASFFPSTIKKVNPPNPKIIFCHRPQHPGNHFNTSGPQHWFEVTIKPWWKTTCIERQSVLHDLIYSLHGLCKGVKLYSDKGITTWTEYRQSYLDNGTSPVLHSFDRTLNGLHCITHFRCYQATSIIYQSSKWN